MFKLKGRIGTRVGLLAAMALLLPAAAAQANSFEAIQDQNATANIGTEFFFGSTGPAVAWDSGLMPPLAQFFQIQVGGQPADLVATGTPTLTDTNGFLDPNLDKFQGSWLGQGSATGVSLDLSITLRGGTSSSLTELASVTNDSNFGISLYQYVVTSFDGSGPIIPGPINDNTFGFNWDGYQYLEAVTPPWDSGMTLDGADGGPTGAAVWWNIPAGGSLLLSKVKNISVPEPSIAALLAFGLLGMLGLGLVRRRRTAARGAALPLLAAALLFGGAGSARAIAVGPLLPTLTAGNFSVDFGSGDSNTLDVNWNVDGETWITQNFSFDGGGTSGNLGPATLVDVQPVSPSEATLTFADAPADWNWLVSMNFNLAALGSASDLAETINAINSTQEDFTFTQTVYPSLGGSFAGDEINQDQNVTTVVDGNAYFQEVVLPFPDGQSVCSQCEPSSFSYSWDVGAGQSVLIQKDKHLDVPEPSVLALLGLGALVTLRARRRA